MIEYDLVGFYGKVLKIILPCNFSGRANVMHRPSRSIFTVLPRKLIFVLTVDTLDKYRINNRILLAKIGLHYLKYIVVNLIKDFWAETISVVNWSRLVSLSFKLLLDTTITLSYVSSWNVRMKWSDKNRELEVNIYRKCIFHLTFKS